VGAAVRAGPVSPWVIDALLGTAVALAIALIISADQGSDRSPDVVAYLFALGFGVLMLLRRIAPHAVLVITVLGLFAYYAMGYPSIGVAVPVVAALFAAADVGMTLWPVCAGAVVFGVSTFVRIREGEPLAYLLGYEAVSNLALIAAAIALGFSFHARRLRAAQQAEITRLMTLQLAREGELRMQRERERISRDLHDTVGHTMAVISLHAGVAADAIGAGNAAASEAVERIRAASSQTLRDLGSTVRILRSTARPEKTTGVLSLAAVPDLVETAEGAGVEVTTDITVAPSELSPQVDAAAYRVVQEAVTNVVKHARASRARIAACIVDGMLLLKVTDDGRGAGATDSPGGHGLAGMTERVHILGGTLTTRTSENAGFTVEARLPARLEP
jgi:signal transduction histidine kinase